MNNDGDGAGFAIAGPPLTRVDYEKDSMPPA
jgi:hypothetical protein